MNIKHFSLVTLDYTLYESNTLMYTYTKYVASNRYFILVTAIINLLLTCFFSISIRIKV